MLFNKNGLRQFYATQSNGSKRHIVYEIAPNRDSVVREVDGLCTTEYPLSEQFNKIVVGWCDEHRANLHKHDDYRSAA